MHEGAQQSLPTYEVGENSVCGSGYQAVMDDMAACRDAAASLSQEVTGPSDIRQSDCGHLLKCSNGDTAPHNGYCVVAPGGGEAGEEGGPYVTYGIKPANS